jgi:YD repeat-containing protein
MGNSTKYSYTYNGQLASVTKPLGQMTSYGYDANNNLYTLTDPAGHIITSIYTVLNQLQKKVWADNVHYETYGYDNAGNMLAHGWYDGVTNTQNNYTYNNMNRLYVINYFDGWTVTYGYTANGLRQQVTDTARSSAPTNYAYDYQNRVKSITQPNNTSAVSYTYDAASNRTSMKTYANGSGTATGNVSYSYYDNNWLQTVSDVQSGKSTGYQ